MSTGHAPQPRESAWRCALRAESRGEPMPGTAFVASRVLMVEQPGPWGESGLADSQFDSSVAHALTRRTKDAGMRLLVIRRPGRTPGDAPRRWMIADCSQGQEQLFVGTFTADAELLDLPLDGSAGVADPEPVFLVCAHGKHDACCALRGRTLAAALHDERPGRVFECSHLGGHRFAANVLVLPGGLLYGRVLPVAAPEFVAAALAGEVVGGLLRGRVGLPPAVQAALAFAYEHLALRRRDDLHVVDVGDATGDCVEVRLTGPRGDFMVNVSVAEVAADTLSCDEPGPAQVVAYRPVSITPVG